MAENKTKPNGASVVEYLAQIEDDNRRKDCESLGVWAAEGKSLTTRVQP
jgi:hypothetical protein